MTSSKNWLGWLILIVILIAFLVHEDKETWANYETGFNTISTGQTPMYFYNKPLYRKPYRYPFQFFSSYPVPNLSFYSAG